MKLFVLNGVDYTNRIVVPSYKISSFSTYTEWVDGNFTTHRDNHVDKLKGTFTLKFQTQNEYFAFLNTYNRALNKDGTVRTELYSNKHNITREAYVFLDFDPENTLPYMGYKDYEGFEVTIQER